MSDNGWGDPRLPSGSWSGFYLYSSSDVQNRMSLRLEFDEGEVRGEGVDGIGEFMIHGSCCADADGKVRWTKMYLDCACCEGSHDVTYDGNADGNGIWGTWTFQGKSVRGGFRIWPNAQTREEPDTKLDEIADPIDLEPVRVVVGFSVHAPFPEAI